MNIESFLRQIIPELAKQSPALIVVGLISLGFLVLIFRYLRSRDKEQQELFHEAMLTIKENSKVLGQVQNLLQHLLFTSASSVANPSNRQGQSREDRRYG